MFRLNHIIELLKKIFLFSSIGLVPLIFSPYLSQSFELPKMIFLRIFILLSLVLFLLQIFLQRRNIGQKIAEIFYGSARFLLIAINLFFIALILATLFSPYFHLSWAGLQARQMGLESYLYYFLFFWLFILNISSLKEIDFIFKIIASAVFVVSVYGFLQVLGLDPINWTESVRVRVISAFGQPNFFASWLILTLPIVFYLFVESKNKFLKFIYFFIFSLSLVNVFLTYSFASWIGLGVGLVVFLFLVRKQILARQNMAPLFLIIIVLASTIFYFNHQQKWFLTQKFSLTKSLNPASTLTARLDIWRASWQAFLKHPILGYGLDAQGEALYPYYQKNWALHSNVNVQPTRAHNIFLDILLTSGLVGLFSFLLVLFLLFKFLWQNIKTGQNKNLFTAILIGLVAYLVSLLFGFSSVASEFYFWLFLAVVIILAKINKRTKLQSSALRLKKKFFYPFFGIVCLGLIIMVVGRVHYEFRRLIADYYWQNALTARRYNQFFDARVFYEYIDDLKVDNYYPKAYAAMLVSWLPEIEYFGGGYKKVVAEKYLPELLPQLNGNRFNDYILRARVFTLIGEDNKQYLEKAKNNLSYVTIKVAQRSDLYRYQAELDEANGDFESAYKNYFLAISKLPDLNNSYLNLNPQHKQAVEYEFYLVYRGLGDLFAKQNNWQKAEKYYLLAKKNNIKNYNIYHRLSLVAKNNNNLKQAIFYNQKGEEASPDYDWSWPLELARLYNELGDKEKTREYAQKVLKYYPQNQEAKELLNK